MKQAAIEYPIQTHSQDCHHESPLGATIMEEEIIQVFCKSVISFWHYTVGRVMTDNVEGICNPKAHKVPRAPLPTFWFNWGIVNKVSIGIFKEPHTRLQVMVVQHQLGICQTWFTLHSQLVHPMGKLCRLDLLHDEVEEVRFV